MSLDVTKYTKSKFLKASDLDLGRPTQATVKRVYEHTFEQENETKVVIEFREFDQHLVLNKTQIMTLVGMFGAQTGTWQGQRLNLTAVPSNYQGKPTILITADAAPPMFGGQRLQSQAQYDAVAPVSAPQQMPMQPEVRFQ